MKPESYVQDKLNKLVADVLARAPGDVCPSCPDGNGHLAYDGYCFYYECDGCGARWSADCLEIDPSGYFSLLEWAD